MLTNDWRYWHSLYEDESFPFKNAVDKAYDAARSAIQSQGYSTANDDRAEELVAAIVRYIIESESLEKTFGGAA
jgi:hypothetical protein